LIPGLFYVATFYAVDSAITITVAILPVACNTARRSPPAVLRRFTRVCLPHYRRLPPNFPILRTVRSSLLLLPRWITFIYALRSDVFRPAGLPFACLIARSMTLVDCRLPVACRLPALARLPRCRYLLQLPRYPLVPYPIYLRRYTRDFLRSFSRHFCLPTWLLTLPYVTAYVVGLWLHRYPRSLPRLPGSHATLPAFTTTARTRWFVPTFVIPRLLIFPLPFNLPALRLPNTTFALGVTYRVAHTTRFPPTLYSPFRPFFRC